MDSSEDESGSSVTAEDQPSRDLIDLEASEDGDSEDSSVNFEAEVDEDDFDYGPYAIGRSHLHWYDTRDFPQFLKLPIELRRRIWDCHCPQLDTQRQVLDFTASFGETSSSMAGSSGSSGFGGDVYGWSIAAGFSLSQHTEPVRNMLATHRESRSMALKRFPDMLTWSVEGDLSCLRFDKQKDVVYLENTARHDPMYDIVEGVFSPIWGFSDEVLNLAMDPPLIQNNPYRYEGGPEWIDLSLLLAFPNLENYYSCLDAVYYEEHFRPSELMWCVSDHAHNAMLETREITPGLSEDSQRIYCWHKSEVPCDFESHCKPLAKEMKKTLNPDDAIEPLDLLDEPVPDLEPRLDRLRRVRKFPMRCFVFEEGIIRYAQLQLAKSTGRAIVGSRGLEDAWESDDYPSFDDSLDEYESEGIDDNPIIDPDTEDEAGHGTTIEDDTLAMELLSDSAPCEFSPLEEEPPRSPIKRPAARRVVLDDSDEDEESDKELSSAPARGKKRARVVSDDEEDSDAEEQGTREPPAKRRPRIVVSDDEEDSDVQELSSRSHSASRKPIVVSDSDGAEQEEEEEPRDKVNGHSRSRRVVNLEDDEEDSEEEEESGDSEEEGDEPRPLSLAEKLARGRQTNPSESGSDEEEDSFVEADEDSRYNYGYGAGESGEDDEDDSEMDENAHGGLADMADEGSEDDEDPDEDDGY